MPYGQLLDLVSSITLIPFIYKTCGRVHGLSCEGLLWSFSVKKIFSHYRKNNLRTSCLLLNITSYLIEAKKTLFEKKKTSKSPFSSPNICEVF